MATEVPASWLVRTADGRQFSVADDRDRADAVAESIGGTVEWYTPTQSTYWSSGEKHYDH